MATQRKLSRIDTSSSTATETSNKSGDTLKSIIPVSSTEITQTNQSNGLVRVITIRTTSINEITIPYDIRKERRKARNLIANGHKLNIARTDNSVE